jgi:hypothetical protein
MGIFRSSFLILIFCSVYAAVADSKLSDKLSVSSRKSPRSFRVTGPVSLTERGKGSWDDWTGCGYTIFWGDGKESFSPKRGTLNCASGLDHQYKNSGPYSIKAEIWNPGPTDKPEVIWTDEIEVSVK